MRPSRAVYNVLSSFIYPIFEKKMTLISGTENLPKSGGFLIAANHIDWLDGFYIAAAIGKFLGRPVFFLTKTNNYWWTRLTIQIPPENTSSIIDTAVDQLQRGRIICNFPEGLRNFAPTLAPGKTGTARMAIIAGVPVVPLGISCEPGKTMAQSITNLFSSKHMVRLRFGSPLRMDPSAGPARGDESKTLTNRIMAAIAPLAGKKFSE